MHVLVKFLVHACCHEPYSLLQNLMQRWIPRLNDCRSAVKGMLAQLRWHSSRTMHGSSTTAPLLDIIRKTQRVRTEEEKRISMPGNPTELVATPSFTNGTALTGSEKLQQGRQGDNRQLHKQQHVKYLHFSFKVALLAYMPHEGPGESACPPQQQLQAVLIFHIRLCLHWAATQLTSSGLHTQLQVPFG